jgi:hypothetical protein
MRSRRRNVMNHIATKGGTIFDRRGAGNSFTTSHAGQLYLPPRIIAHKNTTTYAEGNSGSGMGLTEKCNG